MLALTAGPAVAAALAGEVGATTGTVLRVLVAPVWPAALLLLGGGVASLAAARRVRGTDAPERDPR